MDGIPIMEKQFVTLTKLFPILDPFMANKLKSVKIEEEIGHIQWIFYLDYDWVDQIIDSSKSNGAYHIYLNNLNLNQHAKISEYLLKKNLLGNFIWVSKNAWKRLQLESPYMSQIIETLEIEDGSNEIIYLIKFEQLIPRLQKYYNFETYRNILKAFDTRDETMRFTQLMRIEIDKALSVEHLMMILENIQNYQWQGFSEKEHALNLAIKTFEKYTNFMSSPENELILKAKVVKIVNDVGFPCQNIFNAHINKLMVRKPEFIIETIQNPNSKYFNEIWVLLSTGSFSMFDNDTIKRLITAYKLAIDNKESYKKSTFIANQTSALINLLNLLSEPSSEYIEEVINFSVPMILSTKPEIEEFCVLLDSVVAIEKSMI